MMTQLVIFDMDGTILDTLQDLADATNVVLKNNGYPTHSIDRIRQFVGNGIGKLIERALPGGTDAQTQARILREFSDYYRVHCADHTKPYEGVCEMLLALRAEGVRTAVVSNKADFAVQALVADYFNGLFDFALGETAARPKKPAPDMVLAAIEACGVPQERAVFVGDSEVDVETAQNAGVRGVFVTWGFRDAATIRAAGGKRLVDSPTELLTFLKEL